MASNSRQRSSSSGSDIRVIRGGAAGGDRTQRIQGAESGSFPRRSGSLSAPAPDVKTQKIGRANTMTIGELRRESERMSASGFRADRDERAARRAESRARQRRRSRLPIIIACVIAGLAVSFAVLYLILVNTNIFEIQEVEFEGSSHLTSQEASALVSIPQGTTLLNVDTSQVAASLERDAWVKDVQVIREFPHKLKIVIQERSIGAIVEVTTGAAQTIQNWAIADDGMWLMIVPSKSSQVGSQLAEQIYDDADKALHIIGVPYGLEPSIGTYSTDPNVNNALQIVTGMTTSLADQVKYVSAAEAESIVLTLDNNIEIAFGSSANIREKERICLQIMEDNPKVVYINVRVPDRPTWRSA